MISKNIFLVVVILRAYIVHFWCSFGAFLVHFWWHLWCIFGAYWCIVGAVFVHFCQKHYRNRGFRDSCFLSECEHRAIVAEATNMLALEGDATQIDMDLQPLPPLDPEKVDVNDVKNDEKPKA